MPIVLPPSNSRLTRKLRRPSLAVKSPTGCRKQPFSCTVWLLAGTACQNALIHPFAQSAPIGGGVGVNVGSGVEVGGSGVDVASPAATVSVGTGVSTIVAVGTFVHVGTGVGVGSAPKLLP